MPTLKELLEQRSTLLTELDGILDAPAGESGDLSDDQQTRHDQIHAEIGSLDTRIQRETSRIDARDQQAALEARANQPANRRPIIPDVRTGASAGEKRDVGKFSLGRALQKLAVGEKLDGVEAEMAQEGEAEARAAGITPSGNGIILSGTPRELRDHYVQDANSPGTVNAGGNLVQTSVGTLLDALMEGLVFDRLGADINRGLAGNLRINRIVRGTAPTHKDEVNDGRVSADEYTATFEAVELTPKRLPTFLDVSKQLLIQNEYGAANLERRLRNHVENELRVQMERFYVSDILGTSGINDGDLNSAGTPTFQQIVELAGLLRDDNVNPDQIRFLMNTAVQTYLLYAPMTVDGSSNPVDSMRILPTGSDRLVGRPYAVSNVVPSDYDWDGQGSSTSVLMAGDFSGYSIAQFSGMEFLVDPYTQAADGFARIHAAIYHDGVVNDPAKFARMANIDV